MSGERALSNLGLFNKWTPGSDGYHVGMDQNFARLDALVFLAVLTAPVNDPPTAPAKGDRYIVGNAPTGVFVGHGRAIALFNVDGAWEFIPPSAGWRALALDDKSNFLYDGTAWTRDAKIFDIAIYCPVLPAATDAIASVCIPGNIPAVTFPAGLPLSAAYARVPDATARMLPIMKNGTQVGYVSFAANALIGSFSLAAQLAMVSGDEFEVFPPSGAGVTLAKIRLIFCGTR